MSSVKCSECGFVNFVNATNCKRCQKPLTNLQQAPPGSVVTEDGYVLPPPPSVGLPSGGLWRDESTLVMEKNATLPDRCVKCNEPAMGVRLKRKLSWHHPILYILIFGGLVFYLIIALIVRKTATLDVGVCARHLKKRRQGIVISWLLIIGGIVGFFAALSLNEGGLALLGMVLFLGGVIYGIVAARLVAPSKIDDRLVWLRGLNKDYLSDLPAWPGY